MRNYLTNIYRWLKASLADTKGFQRSVQLFAGILLLGLVSIKTSAQLGRYQFNGTAICPNNAINVQTQPANATFSGYTTTGTTCVASSSTFLNSAWTTGSTVNVNEYTQFSLTPAASYVLTLTTMTFKHAVSVNGSTTTTWYLRSSVDNYATNIATGASTTGNSTPTITFPAASFTAIGAITFRLYLTNANGGTTTWYHDDVTLNGSVVRQPNDPPNPTSNSPQCATVGVAITNVAAVPATETWYWQTAPAGISTANTGNTYMVFTSGTYYLRARDNTTLAWSAGAGSVTVIATPDVGVPVFAAGSSTTRCQGAASTMYSATASDASSLTFALDAASLAAGNTIDAATGTVTYTASWSGSSSITATATGCSTPQTATHTVTITPSVSTPVFALGTSSARCQGAGTVTYTASATNTTGITYSLDAASLAAGNTIIAATGAVTYVVGWSGTTTVRASASGCSGPKIATLTVTVTPTVGTPVFALGASSARCQGGNTVTYTASSTNSTALSYSLDGASTSAGNTINSSTGDVTYTAAWTGTSVITATASGCNGPRTSSHTVTTTASVGVPVFTLGATSTRCQASGTVTYTATATATTGIAYTLDAASLAGANSINSATGAVTFAAGWIGTTVITASAAGCSGPQTSTHTVTTNGTITTPVFALGATSTRCQGAGTVNYSASSSYATGITYSLDATSLAAGNSINSSTGDVTYTAGWSSTSTITASAAGCSGPKTATHIVTITPAATANYPSATSSRCQLLTNVNYGATFTNNLIKNYSLDAASLAAGLLINPNSGVVSYTAAWTGTAIITATATGCNGSVSAQHTATTNPNVGVPSFSMGATSTRCQGANAVTYSATASGATLLVYKLDNTSLTAGNSIDTLAGKVTYAAGYSGTSVITVTANGCGTPTTATHTVTITPTVGTPVFALGASSSRCQAAGTVTYTATATTNTGITYSLDGASLAGGNTIAASSGDVTYNASWVANSVITATATGCNGPKTATHTVTVSGPVTAPAFTLGANSIRCQGAGTVTYTATANYTTGITYSLDAASITGGNFINTFTGAVTYVAGWSGSSVITASAAGCFGPQSNTHIITTTPTVGTPVFTMGVTSTRCQGANQVTYDASATTTTGISYSLNAAALAGGNTIDVTTGQVTYVQGWTGSTIITASAAGCNGPKTTSHTVTITVTVGTPVFTLGATTTRCRGAATVIYAATATNNTGITYSLDAASLSAGNTINTSTGAVTYVSSWYGTSVITASAAGCNGPATADHTVTITDYVTTPVFALGSNSTRCQGAAAFPVTATSNNTTGITYSVTGGPSINSSTGVVSYNNTYVGTATITASAAGCNGPATATHTLTVIATVGTPVFALGTSSSRCQGAGTVNYGATATTTTGITYSLDPASAGAGNTIDANTADVTWAAGWTGTSTITASAAGCNGPSTATHTVTSNGTIGSPVFTLGASSTRCQGGGNVSYSATSQWATGMSYSLDAASLAGGNTINASTGTVTYSSSWSGTTIITVTATGCTTPKSASHTVTVTATVGTPVFTLGSTSTRCQDAGSVMYDATATTTTGITYSLNNGAITGGNTIDAATGQVTYVAGWIGTTTITASAAGCNGPNTAIHTVTLTPTVGTPIFTLGTTSTRCRGAGSVTYTATSTNNTGITYSLDPASTGAGNTIDASAGTVTYVSTWFGTSVITATATGCNGPSTSNHTVTITDYVTIPVFALGSSSNRCQGAASFAVTATANNITGITYSVTGGATINSGTGVVSYGNNYVGTSIITASAAGCNGPQTATHTLTVTATVGTPVFTLGASSARCQGAGTVNYGATATTTTGITYSLDAASLAGGNTIDPNTGDVMWSAVWSGTSTITASAAGCNGPATATHTVTTNLPVSVPVFTLGATSTRCQGNGGVTYSATTTNSTSLTYSLDAASITGGNSINASSGQVSYSSSWSGTSVISATATGCYGPQTSTHTVTITPTVGTPVFTLGITSTRCQGAGSVTYDATATTTTGITYTLNNGAITGGNSINGATGEVTYVAGWTSSTIITASAAGCNGPKTATHTVTITPTVGTPIFTLGATSARCRAAGTVTYTATSTNNTGITYSQDPASTGAGNTINASTGAVTYVSTWFGTSVITANATGCNGPATANHTVTITDYVTTPVFALGASSTRCQGGATQAYTASSSNTTGITYSISGGPSINSSTGVVAFTNGYSGTAVVTASAAGCSGPQTATHTITVTATVGTPVFTLGSTSTRCQGAVTVNYGATATTTTGITYFLDGTSLAGGNTIDANTGNVTYTGAWSGTSTITASAAGCGGPLTATHTVTINQPVTAPVFTLGASSVRCQAGGAGAAVTYTATTSNSTGLTYSLDAATIAGGNTINGGGRVTWVAGWSGTSVITATATGCSGPQSSTHTVTTTPIVGTPVFALGSTSTRCQGAGTVNYTATANSTTGITYTIDNTSSTAGNTINASSGDVTYVATWSGTTTITASAAGCSGPKTATHTVTVTPTVGTPVFTLGATSTRCQGAGTITYTATATNSTGITYGLDASSLAAGNTINTSTGTITWTATWSGTSTITATGQGCNGPSATATHTVTTNATVANPVFVLGSSSTRCQGVATLNYTASASNTTGLTYTLDAASITGGNTINAATGAVTYTAGWTGTSVITVSAAGCSGPKTASHTVTITPTVGTPVFAAGASSSRCQGAAMATYGASATNTTGITYSLDGASLAGGNTINPSTGDVTYTAAWSGASIITASAAGCNGPRTASHTVSINAPVTTPIFAAGSTSTRCQGAGSVTYSATASNTTGITYSLDASSLAAGNTIASTTGVITYTASWTGTSVITASAAGCYGPQPSYLTVTITPSTGTPVFDLGATSTRCQGVGTITYNATANYITSMTYNLDGSSLTAGNTINGSTGAVTYTATWVGTSIITATALGCNGPKSTSHTVSLTPNVTTPVFTTGASTTRCQGAGTVTYTATASNTTGITYTLDATTLTAGNTINAATGAVTYTSTWTGVSTITASAAGCGGPKTSNHTVTTTTSVGTPIFAAGSSSSRCQGVGTVTYTATSLNSTSITYSIDGTSTASGVSINAATGIVSYPATWSGTTIVTATAAGCNGPKAASHTVTTTATVGTPVFTAGSTSYRCLGGGTITYTATASAASSIVYSLDGSSIAAGNNINAATGAVTYMSGWTGVTTITVNAVGCNSSSSATHTVTTNNPVTQPVFAMGDTSVMCQSNATMTYSASSTNYSSLIYKLDDASLTYATTIDTLTGTVTWDPNWSGLSTITVTAQGCYGPLTSTHAVKVLGSVGTTTFALGNASYRCQAAETSPYTAYALNAFNITYSLDAGSTSAGNTINSATGAVTFVSGWSGNSKITAVSAGCNGPTTAYTIVTTNLPTGNPIFAQGSNSVRCRKSGPTTYLASAAFAFGMSYSLDAAALSAGNTIDATTGVVTYTEDWSGTSTITATAIGCGNPSATHTAFTNTAQCSSTLFGSTYIEKVKAGSVVINMGITPQTIANGLKPYGLVYALLKTNIPVKWVINSQKNKDGVDFVHNGVSYRGGTFIILQQFLSPATTTLINTWKTKGVQTATTVSDFDVEVSYTFNSPPFWVMDAQNGKIAVAFLDAAEIPATAYIFKSPDQLGYCDDIYVMPHADPTWPTHKNLWYWNRDYHGAIWEGCHAVSVMENLYGPDVDTPSITRKMNFLMQDNPAGPDKTAVYFGNHSNPTPPFVTQFPTHPIMQFMGVTDQAHMGGSEQVFLPYKPGGGWRPTTYVAVYDPSQVDVPSKSDGPAALVTYGRGFGDPKRGFIVTEGGHNVGGSTPDEVAAQRIFLNSSFVFVLDKQAEVAIKNLPSAMFSLTTYIGFTATAKGTLPGITFTYKWISSGGGTFSNANSAVTNFTAPFTASASYVTITCQVTDNCGRVAFDTRVIPLFPSPRPPVALNDSATLYKQCAEPSVTVDVLMNDYDPDGDPMTVSLIGSGVNGNFSSTTSGLVTYVPNPGFVGKDVITYQVCDNTSRCATATLTISVSAPIDANGCSANQFWGVYGKITAARATISSGTPRGNIRGLLDPDGTVGDSSTYSFFNSNGQAIIYSLSAPIPTRVANIDTFLYIYADALLTGNKFTVTQSADSTTWTRIQQFTVNSTDDFLEGNVKKYGVVAGTKFIKVTTNQNSAVYIDGMLYKLYSCIGALPVVNDDQALTLEDVPVCVDVLSNDEDYQNSKLIVAGITQQPSFGYVSIKLDGTLRYVNKKDQIGTRTDFFKYRACNTKGLCSEAQVSVNIIADSCGAGRYKPFSLSAPITSTRNPISDAYVKNAQPTTNYGTSKQLRVKGSGDTLRQRSFLKFDVSNIPPNAIVDSAMLYMYLAQKLKPAKEILEISDASKAWTETGVTWNNYALASAWTLPGGDMSGNVWAATNMDTTNNTYKSWNMRSLVQSYARGGTANMGVVVTRSPEAASSYYTEARFYSRDSASYKPYLYIKYRVPGACTIIGSSAPFAMPDTVKTISTTPIVIDVRKNDVDYNGTGMSISLLQTTTSRGASLTMSGNDIMYTPPPTTPRYNGPDTLKYLVCSSGLCDSTYVIVNVTNAPPSANADSVAMLSNTTSTASSKTVAVLANDYDPEGNSISSPFIYTKPKNGAAVVSGNNIIYTPNTNFIGIDSMIYQIMETGTFCTALADTAKLTFRVNNRPPTAVNDAVTINRCEVRTLKIVANDIDPEGQVLSISSFTQIAAGNGSLALANNSTQLIYTPPSGGNTLNNPIAFTYYVKDAYDAVSATPATVTINFRNPAAFNDPIALRDTFKINRNSVLYADILTNDYDPDGHDLLVPVTILTNATKGTTTPLSNGLVKYEPSSNTVSVDSFEYQITSNIVAPAGCISPYIPRAKAWAYILIDNKPEAIWDYATTLKNKAVTIEVLNNDFFGSGLPASGLITVVSTPGYGTTTVLSNGSTTQQGNTIKYTPANNYIGKDQFVYSICDMEGQCDTAIVKILVKRDTDNDGIPDDIDIDDDNDGIVDVVEVCGNGALNFSCMPGGKDPAFDDDEDGIVNWKDPDYGPLNANGCNTQLDSDGDGVPDFIDRDSDNDGITDVAEAGGVDTNGDGVIDNFTDTDGDGLSQNVDANNTGEAGSGSGLGFADTDNDNVPNSTDLDSDGDGIPDIREVLASDANNDGRVDVTADTDGDGLANFVDGDIDNDGIIDNPNGPLLKTGPDGLDNGRASSYPNKNADWTGKANPYDLDADGDGIGDATEASFPPSISIVNGVVSGAKTNGWANSVRALASLNLINTDVRGPANYLDIDSDDDGISDNIEGQSTFSYILPTDIDSDGDGISDAYDVLVNNYGGNGITTYDHDFDNIPDYLDLDTDNDGALDINEASKYMSLTQTNINTGDADGDGLLDQFDGISISSLSQDRFKNVTNNQMGASGSWNGPLPSGSNVLMVRSLLSGDRDWRANFILPLNILSFYGTLINNIANLVWLVENEQQVDHYKVERSIDGISFEQVGMVSSKNLSSSEYRFDDNVKNINSLKFYYRIIQVNKSGAVFNSGIIRFKKDSMPGISIKAYPNPMSNYLNINVTSSIRQPAKVLLLDGGGKTVQERLIQLEKGQNATRMDNLSYLASGMYLIKIITVENTYVEKVIKE